MATEPLHGGADRVPAGEPVTRPFAPDRRGPEPVTGALDVVTALAELRGEPPPIEQNGLADALLAWLTPRPRSADTLSQSRIAPLLGHAIEMLAKANDAAPDIASLGGAALEQELRMQRALAERRTTLLGTDIA